jgi:hypothetical protein
MEAITDSAVDRRVSANAEICPKETPRGCISVWTDWLRQSNVFFHSYEVQFNPFNRHALLFSIPTMSFTFLFILMQHTASILPFEVALGDSADFVR